MRYATPREELAAAVEALEAEATAVMLHALEPVIATITDHLLGEATTIEALTAAAPTDAFNPWHDPATGRFTHAPGGGGAGDRGYRSLTKRFRPADVRPHSNGRPGNWEVDIGGSVGRLQITGERTTREQAASLSNGIAAAERTWPLEGVDGLQVQVHSGYSDARGWVEPGVTQTMAQRTSMPRTPIINVSSYGMSGSEPDAAYTAGPEGVLWERVPIHEYGHIAHQMSLGGGVRGVESWAARQWDLRQAPEYRDQPGHDWDFLYDVDRISDYGRTHPLESVAEAFTEFVYTGGRAREGNAAVDRFSQEFGWVPSPEHFGQRRLPGMGRTDSIIDAHNPYHDERGRFTHAPGGGAGGGARSGPEVVDVTPIEVERDNPFQPTTEHPSEAAWRAIMTDEAKSLDDPKAAHPERYDPNPAFGVHLREGEIETRVARPLEAGPPRIHDVTPIPRGTPSDQWPEERVSSGTLMPNAVVPGSERPPQHVYRVMALGEFDQAQQRGYLRSDERMNLGDEGTVTSLRSTGTFYAPLDGSPYRIARIDYTDGDGWRLDPADGYVKTHDNIPFSRISAVTPPIEGRRDVRRTSVLDWLDDWLREGHNPYHDERGRFTHAPGGGAGGERHLGQVPLTEKWVQDFQNGSAARHLRRRSDGSWEFTPERQALHDRIISEALEGKVAATNPTFHLLGGGPASGKSHYVNSEAGAALRDARDTLVVNADDMKAKLPEYQERVSRGDASAAAFAHEESSYLSRRLLDAGYQNRHNVTLDGTGDSRPEKLRSKIEQARAHGYAVEGHYMTVDTEVAVARANARGDRTGRYVPETFIRNTHAQVSNTVDATWAEFDRFELFDTSENRNEPVMSGENGRLTIHNEERWQAFLAKGRRGATTAAAWLADWAREAHNPYHDERGRFTFAPGNRAGGGAVAAEPISRSDLSNPDTPRSRAVSRDEFNRIAQRGQQRLAELRRNARPTTNGIGDDAKWNEVKDSSWEAVQEEWGGATVNAHTGEPIEGTPNLYAMSVKPPGMQSVRVPIGSDRASFDAAMDEARSRFANELTYDQFHLGVFRDEDVGGIDIDPVLIVDNIGDVESIGAFTHAVGGAYNFADGNGYWPPHIEE